jgi:hypothetical protein
MTEGSLWTQNVRDCGSEIRPRCFKHSHGLIRFTANLLGHIHEKQCFREMFYFRRRFCVGDRDLQNGETSSTSDLERHDDAEFQRRVFVGPGHFGSIGR